MNKKFYCIVLPFFLLSCTHVKEIKNRNKGKLTATHQLVINGEKKFLLDDNTATRPPYIQMFKDSSGVRMLTLLNPYNHSIYFYNYTETQFTESIRYEREGPNGILGVSGYYIRNIDSIYVYNRPLIEMVLTNRLGLVKKRIPLWNSDFNWQITHPQYDFSTVNAMFCFREKLFLTGMSPFSISDSLINKFHFTACIDIKTNETEFMHTYPGELFGSGACWDDPVFMNAYPVLSPSGEIIHSFAMSHFLYLTNCNTGICKTVYGGSNVAGTIYSIDSEQKKASGEVIGTYYLQQDLYAAILHDPWRKVYYRYLLRGIPETNVSPGKKPIVVILMDEQFNYLGETPIGTGEKWNWKNSFVTEEGLNIEYIDETDLEEVYLNFKIFKMEEL
ncbi:MAG: DUF4221 domain-containing protein [Tannerella sp.]|jgi:hypothetical protein|nr:DUF4221 domain-containing protein [Tannerella sp.]